MSSPKEGGSSLSQHQEEKDPHHRLQIDILSMMVKNLEILLKVSTSKDIRLTMQHKHQEHSVVMPMAGMWSLSRAWVIRKHKL